jgi:hypothetical protein
VTRSNAGVRDAHLWQPTAPCQGREALRLGLANTPLWDTCTFH